MTHIAVNWVQRADMIPSLQKGSREASRGGSGKRTSAYPHCANPMRLPGWETHIFSPQSSLETLNRGGGLCLALSSKMESKGNPPVERAPPSPFLPSPRSQWVGARGARASFPFYGVLGLSQSAADAIFTFLTPTPGHATLPRPPQDPAAMSAPAAAWPRPSQPTRHLQGSSLSLWLLRARKAVLK